MAPKPPSIRPRPPKPEGGNKPARQSGPVRTPKAAPILKTSNSPVPASHSKFPKPRVVRIENGVVIDSADAAKRDAAEIKTARSFTPRPHPVATPREHGALVGKTGTTPRELANKAIKNRPNRMPRQTRSMIAEHKFVAKEGAMTGDETDIKLERDTLYWTPLGGLEEIGRNCSFFEYNDEIVILDMGIQFPEEDTPGIDWIIPNIKYLEKKKKNIKGIIITHAHYDHFGAIPYVLERLGNPVIYGTALIREIIKKRLDEIPNAPKLRFEVIKNHTRSKLSEHFTVEFFGVAHTVPDTTGVMFETPAGKIVHFADFRLEYDKDGNIFNMDEYEWLGKQGVHSLMIDSTGADKDGHTVSEEVVTNNLEKIFIEAEGRIILSTFASMIERLAEIIKIAEKIGRYVIINGRSMKDNLEIARQLGYLTYKNGSLIPPEDINRYPDNKILVITPGSQGQENSGLMRILTGEHRNIKTKPGDTIILSSSVIPGNERSVQQIKDNFIRQGAIVITNNDLDIHSSGHCPGPDLALVAKICKPKYIIPVHGYIFQRAANFQNMKTVGIGKERVILADNGQVLKFTTDSVEITKHHVDASYVMVDGLGVGDVEAVVLRDRKLLAQEGMIVIIMTMSRSTGRLIKNPDVISRGFIYLKDHGQLIDEMRTKIKNLVNQANHTQKKQGPEDDFIKALIRDQIGLYLYNKTLRRPMILPVLIEV